jgi:uncharacterized protein affecting Mg2+/Co2+ transport
MYKWMKVLYKYDFFFFFLQNDNAGEQYVQIFTYEILICNETNMQMRVHAQHLTKKKPKNKKNK